MKKTEDDFYGLPELKEDSKSPWAKTREKLENDGYFVLEDVFDNSLLQDAIQRLHEVYNRQVDEIGGLDKLKSIQEENTIRLPFLYDDFFLRFFCHDKILDTLKEVYCQQFILLAQTGLINEANKEHVATNWHKDLPYQHYASRQPICINALVCLSNFTQYNGSTCLLKGSHQYVEVPDEATITKQQIQIEAPAGSIIFFNSLLFHKMGYNSTNESRYAINHIFGTPVFKQHANFHKMSAGKYKDDPLLRQLLDYPYAVPDSALSYRQNKLMQKNESH